MKVYQVIRCSGQYEDYHEQVIGTYSKVDKAEEEKAKQIVLIEKHTTEYDECRGCCLGDMACFAPDNNGDCCNETWYAEYLYEASVKIREFEVIE